MNKFTKMLAFASLASLGFLSACSDDANTPDPTKAEQCATGLTQDCLLGTWNFNGVKSIEQNTMVTEFDYSAAPGSIEFYIETDRKGNKTQTFKFAWPSANVNSAELDCNPVYGTWELSAGMLNLNSTINNMCFSPKRISVTPTVATNGANIEMKFGRTWLTSNQVTATLGIKEESLSFYTEVLSIASGKQPQQ